MRRKPDLEIEAVFQAVEILQAEILICKAEVIFAVVAVFRIVSLVCKTVDIGLIATAVIALFETVVER